MTLRDKISSKLVVKFLAKSFCPSTESPHRGIQRLPVMLIQKVIGNPQFDGAVNQAGRPVGADREFIGDSESQAKGGDGKVVEPEQRVAGPGSTESGGIDEAMGEIEVETVAVQPASRGHAEKVIVGRRYTFAVCCASPWGAPPSGFFPCPSDFTKAATALISASDSFPPHAGMAVPGFPSRMILTHDGIGENRLDTPGS